MVLCYKIPLPPGEGQSQLSWALVTPEATLLQPARARVSLIKACDQLSQDQERVQGVEEAFSL